MTVAEVQNDLRVSRSTVYNLIKNASLVSVRIGAGFGGVRIKRSSVEAYIGRNTMEAKNAA